MQPSMQERIAVRRLEYMSYTASWSCQKTETHTHGGRYTKKHNAQYEDVKKSLRLIYANLLVVACRLDPISDLARTTVSCSM